MAIKKLEPIARLKATAGKTQQLAYDSSHFTSDFGDFSELSTKLNKLMAKPELKKYVKELAGEFPRSGIDNVFKKLVAAADEFEAQCAEFEQRLNDMEG